MLRVSLAVPQALFNGLPGCIMHLRGGIDAAGLEIRVMYIAELMAAALSPGEDIRTESRR